jgi:hypothetical protein
MLTGKLFALISYISLTLVAAAQTTPPNTPIPVYKTDGTPVPKAHIVVGSVTVPPDWAQDVRSQEFINGIPVTLAGAAAFTSADSYMCFDVPLAGWSPVIAAFRRVDGSHFGIRALSAARGWRQDFICIGN